MSEVSEVSEATKATNRATGTGYLRWVYALIAVAFAVSIVHYADNFTSYDEYPLSDTIPTPSKTLIGLSWFGFAAAAGAALLFLRRGELGPAAIALAGFSLSGLVGIGHYTVEGTGEFPWWRHAHILTDITLGIALAATAVWLWRRRDTLRA